MLYYFCDTARYYQEVNHPLLFSFWWWLDYVMNIKIVRHLWVEHTQCLTASNDFFSGMGFSIHIFIRNLFSFFVAFTVNEKILQMNCVEAKEINFCYSIGSHLKNFNTNETHIVHYGGKSIILSSPLLRW